jgi:dTDP-4-dehydrorhamnose 3,5-epimerase
MTDVEVRPTALDGCVELRLAPHEDRRGSFLKLYQASALAAVGVDLPVQELFISRTRPHGVRGLHHQRPPAAVAKLVWCLEGRVVDAVVDLRRSSATYGQHVLIDLAATAANAVYVPVGFAHGFAVPAGGPALVAYAQSGEHAPDHEGGVLWSSAGIDWGIDPSAAVVSDRDAALPPLDQIDTPFP